MAFTIENGDTPRIAFLLVDATDNETRKTGLTVANITCQISKNGGSFAACTNTAVEIGSGWYYVTLTATETGTDGPLAFDAYYSGISNIFSTLYQVVTTAATTISDSVADAIADRILIRDVDTALTNESVTYGNAAASRTLAAAVTFLGGKIVAGTGSHAFYVKDGDGTALFTRNTDGTSSSGVFPTDVSTDTGA